MRPGLIVACLMPLVLDPVVSGPLVSGSLFSGTVASMLLPAGPVRAQVPPTCGFGCRSDLHTGHPDRFGRRRSDAYGRAQWQRGPDAAGFVYGPPLAGLPLPPPGPPPAGLWFQCASPPGYYPAVAVCLAPWRAVPARPFR